jgi:hypothetical protein
MNVWKTDASSHIPITDGMEHGDDEVDDSVEDVLPFPQY